MARQDVNGRVVAITGSTGGLGSALAKALSAKGAKLALLDLDGRKAEAQARSLDGDARGWAVDVRSIESVASGMNAAAAHFGGIDIAIANAGTVVIEPLVTGDPGKFEDVVDINLHGVWRTFRAALPHVQRRQGYLMAISSMAAFIHLPMQGSYTASKAGVWAMCDSIRLELRPFGVGVGTVHPTFFPTPMMEMALSDPAGGRLLREGNKHGLFNMVTLDTVVNAVVRGIEKRAEVVVVPRRYTLLARAPGVFRRLVERIARMSLDDAKLAEVIAAAYGARSGGVVRTDSVSMVG